MPPFDFAWRNVALIAVGAIPVLITAAMRRRLPRKSNRLVTAIATAVFLLACVGLFAMVVQYQEAHWPLGYAHRPAIIGWLVEAGLVAVVLIRRSHA